MARPRQPVDLLLVKGRKNLTKQEIKERKAAEVKAPNDKIEPPSYLPKILKKEFERISDELIGIGIMSNLDCEALARFVTSEYNYQKVTKSLLKMGVMNPAYYDTVLLQEKLFKMTRQAAQDLGLTISSRCKLVVPTKAEVKEESKFDRMFGNV